MFRLYGKLYKTRTTSIKVGLMIKKMTKCDEDVLYFYTPYKNYLYLMITMIY